MRKDARITGSFVATAVFAALVAGCSSSAQRSGDAGAAQVAAVSYARTDTATAIGSGSLVPQMAGRWYLNDEFERDCYVDLSSDPLPAGHHRAQSSRECSGLMGHVGGWFASADGAEIRLYDAQGRVIARLLRNADQSYKGPLTLSDDQSVVATLRQV